MEKAKQIDSVENDLSSTDELRRRLPEVDAIYEPEIRDKTIEYFRDVCPGYFWERPASATGKYHPPDERDRYGTWLHTKRVFYEYANLSESLLEMHEISEYERACGKSAALIHDTFNYGVPSENREMTTSDHDVIAAVAAKHMVDMPDEVVRLVQRHMGAWADGNLPETRNEMCFHFSDKSAAASNHTQAVYYPADELKEAFPHLEEADIDEPI